MKRGGKRPGSGKKKGSRHVRTLEWESFGKIILSEGLGKAITELRKLRGEKYLYHYEKFICYFKPKPKQHLGLDLGVDPEFLKIYQEFKNNETEEPTAE